ncbi:MAG: VanZ family protein [Gammaproteobacteria bacterium]|nr:VanZ family protein [Gammaproteobacteria bacterium]
MGLNVQPLRYRWFWLGSGTVLVALVLIAALAPTGGVPPFALSDKLLHFATFAFLTVWFLGMVEPRLVWRVLVALVLYGLLIEILQRFTPYRSSEAWDLVADVAGVGTGWLLAATSLRGWCGRVEALLAPARDDDGRRR